LKKIIFNSILLVLLSNCNDDYNNLQFVNNDLNAQGIPSLTEKVSIYGLHNGNCGQQIVFFNTNGSICHVLAQYFKTLSGFTLKPIHTRDHIMKQLVSTKKNYATYDAIKSIYPQGSDNGFIYIQNQENDFLGPKQSNRIISIHNKNKEKLIIATQNNDSIRIFYVSNKKKVLGKNATLKQE